MKWNNWITMASSVWKYISSLLDTTDMPNTLHAINSHRKCLIVTIVIVFNEFGIGAVCLNHAWKLPVFQQWLNSSFIIGIRSYVQKKSKPHPQKKISAVQRARWRIV